MLQTFILTLLLGLNVPVQSDNLILLNKGIPLTHLTREELSLIPEPGAAFPDTNRLGELVDDLEDKVAQAPADAYIGQNGSIIPEKVGQKLDKKKLAVQLVQYFFEGKPNILEVPIQPVYPRVDSEILDSINTMMIGRYTTYFNAGNRERANNIALATKSLNNKVIFPGETFSFNKIVGKRTTEQGYLKAPIIVRGELSEGIGGGICQVSSTLFNAADNAGLKIIQRYSHTKAVTYVPPGRDATVSWYGPDFVFKNMYSQPILIRAKSLGSQLSVSVYSSEYINFKPKSIPGAPAILPKEIMFE